MSLAKVEITYSEAMIMQDDNSDYISLNDIIYYSDSRTHYYIKYDMEIFTGGSAYFRVRIKGYLHHFGTMAKNQTFITRN